MSVARCALTAMILFAPVPGFAQGWISYFDYEQRFSINLPGEPMIEDTTIISLRGDTYPARI